MINQSTLADGANELFSTLDKKARTRIDVRAAMLFCHLKMLGLLNDWPETILDLNDYHSGCLRHLAIQAGITERVDAG